ncbi:MAG: mechanosensitive ion channel family protein [Candidatus Caenarcaniphilales bacterium]|nr:mechanosensitive ion channel family protein [Candidatus Caenarcaniphilales bacterium]
MLEFLDMQLDQEFFLGLLSKEVFSNSVQNYLIAIGIFIVLKYIFRFTFSQIIEKLEYFAEKTSTKFDNYVVELIAGIHPRTYDYIAFYIGAKTLNLSVDVVHILNAILTALIIFQVILSCNDLAVYLLKKVLHVDENSTQQDDKTVFDGLILLIKILLWILGLLLLLANLGVNITSLATSLGIGGIAIALAIQNILSDIFSSFSIYFDKPFAVGDFISVGTDTGTVKKIGLKTTRIQTLQGEELIIGNKELTSTRIQNFRRMDVRRVVFHIGMTYDMSVEQIERAKVIVKESVEQVAGARLDRVHFFEFGDFSLNLEIVYYHPNSDYADYMNGREKVSFYIKEKFDAEGLEFAFPSQTIYLEKSGGN